MRPDLEALARKWIGEPADEMTSEICATEQDVIDLVVRVARHERARWVAILREKAVAACAMSPQPVVAGIDMLNAIADDLEADT